MVPEEDPFHVTDQLPFPASLPPLWPRTRVHNHSFIFPRSCHKVARFMEPGDTPGYSYNEFHLSPSPGSSSDIGAVENPLLSNTEQSSIFDFLSTNFAFHLSGQEPPFFAPPEPTLSVERAPAPWPEPSPTRKLPPISSIATLPSTSSSVISTRPTLTPKAKRDNHIASEQKRRKLIRDSYAHLSLLLEGPEEGPGSNRSLRGSSGITKEEIDKDKVVGKKGRRKGGGKKQGKAGILFRSVEYAKWLREGNDQLKKDVDELRGQMEGAQWQPQPV